MTLGSGRVAIVGTGLIGASVGLAAKRSGAERVAGFDSDPDALAVALDVGAVDSGSASLEEAVHGVDLVVVATPVGAIAALVAEVLASTADGCTVTDVGSTKARICSTLARESRFVGGHPLSGSESEGPRNARPDLFVGSTWFLTRLAETDEACFGQVQGFVSALGAMPVEIDPEAHDRLVALTSHVPHALANVLVGQAAAADALDAGGGSFRDLTRVAGSNPRVWADIFGTNAGPIADALAEYRHRLEDLERMLRAEDVDALACWFEEAARNLPR